MKQRASSGRSEQTQWSASDERCDRAYAERAYWVAMSPDSGKVITLCNYHFRQHQIKLAMAGWSVQQIEREEAA